MPPLSDDINMGRIRPPMPVKLFVSVLTSVAEIIPEVELRLCELYGTVDQRSEAFPFDLTHYYDEEMGSPIQRVFLAFSGLIGPSEIASIKTKTNEIEDSLAGRYTQIARPVNLDPGYLDHAKVVLASTKDFSHRILLAGGIYAEVTLHYQAGEWRPWPWTFPDFRTGRYNGFFSSLRKRYRAQLNAMSER